MSVKNSISKALTDTALSRRSFLKWSAVVGGTAAIAGAWDYGLKQLEVAAQETTSGGEWISASCWHNCGGRCPNYALVKDGVVIRQKADDTHPDSPDFPQQRGCARGRSQRHQVFGADRLKYPMKRKNWEPGGGRKELRGIDEWERISWDEALDLVADETLRIIDQYGNKSILGSSTVINKLGGGCQTWGTVSTGSWPIPTALMGGGAIGSNDRMDIRNSELIIWWGHNPIWSSGGNPTYNWLQAKKAGAKFILVDPFYNDSGQVIADQWIPVRPGTDAALLLGMAYHMIENDLQDQDFLDKYTLGFDADHMPEGADPKENYKDYVLGTYDGQPKTPEWASKICGVDPRTIRMFATEVATKKPAAWHSAASCSRTYRGEQMVQNFLTVAWMTGNVGKPGAMVANTYHAGSSYGGPALVRGGSGGGPYIPNPLFGYFFPYSDLAYTDDWHGPVWDKAWDAILEGEYNATIRGKIPIDIKMIWSVGMGSGGNLLNQLPNINRGIEAYRSVEFVVSNDIVLSTKSKYADIVLPATTPWEQAGEVYTIAGGECLLVTSQVAEPLFEAKSEIWMQRELAKRMGVDPDEIHPLSDKQMWFNKIAGATVITDDGSGYETLVTVTEADLAELGVEGETQTGRIPIMDLIKQGTYQVPRSPGDQFTYIHAKAFIDDPEANPVGTASGKLEIHCQPCADKVNAYGWIDLPPIGQYHPPVEGIEDTYADFDKEVKGEYPLQLYTIHYGRRSHSVFDNIPQLREAFPQEFMINSLDAEARGIEMGDTVLIESRHGKVLRPAYVTNRIAPGVTTLGEGAWVEMDEDLGIDLAGATNVLNGSLPTGQGVQPWNTCNVEVTKWDGRPVDPDEQWPQRIIFDNPKDYIVGGGIE
jgi:anaerobic dimethyl sulfoxide reductase subunit A